jgi:hypothetical protein
MSFVFISTASLEFTFRMWYTFCAFIIFLPLRNSGFWGYLYTSWKKKKKNLLLFFSGLTSHSMIRSVSGHWPAVEARPSQPVPAPVPNTVPADTLQMEGGYLRGAPQEQMREERGNLVESARRGSSVAENLARFEAALTTFDERFGS